MKIFYTLLAVAGGLLCKWAVNRALENHWAAIVPAPRRVPADEHSTAEDVVTGPLSAV